MDDSDEEGFQQPPLQYMYVKKKNHSHANNKYSQLHQACSRNPISIHYNLNLYEYPLELDSYKEVQQAKRRSPSFSDPLEQVARGQESIFLCDFFPKKMNCVYNKFRQNFHLKRDITAVIRNLGSRICNDQLAGFHSKKPIIESQGLTFYSEFEGGNLHCVFQCKQTGFYYLFIQNDTNTHGYNIWFHFNVRSPKAGTYQFVIVNMSRAISHFQTVCLPSFSSNLQNYERVIGINCVESRFRNCENNKNYFSLHFEYQFKQEQDVYFSLTPPYSFSKLMTFLAGIGQSYSNIRTNIDIIAKSELGNSISCIKIAHKQHFCKKIILITARQHPSENVGSFLCQKIVSELLSESQLALSLLSQFTFYIIPMINPDGVIHGNSRTNILGYDTNRSWDPSMQFKSAQCCQIWNFLQHIRQADLDICWAIDLHGHSKQLGFFSYFSDENDSATIFHHILKSKSSLYDKNRCSFGVSSSKKESLRGQLYTKMGIEKSLTIQVSCYGFLNREGKFSHWLDQNFSQMASSILDGIFQTEKALGCRKLKQSLIQQISKIPSLQKTLRHKVEKQLESDSDPEDGYLRVDQRQAQTIKAKEKMGDSISKFSYSGLKFQRASFATGFESFKDQKQRRQSKRDEIKIERMNVLSRSKRQNKSSFALELSFSQNKQIKDNSLIEDNRLSRLRRKVFSEQKHLISSGNRDMKGQEEQESEPILKKSIDLKWLYRLRLKTQTKLSQSRHSNSTRLQTIVYPTSHEAAYFVNSHVIKMRAKSKRLNSIDSKDIMLSVCGQAFISRRMKKK